MTEPLPDVDRTRLIATLGDPISLGDTMVNGPMIAQSDNVTIGVSVAVPEPFGSELAAWRARFGDPLAGAIPAHVTIVPPLEMPSVCLTDIEDHLCAIVGPMAPFRAVLSGTGTFRPVSPVTFVRVAEGAAQCDVLQRTVRSGPLSRELKFEYHPHVTVAHHVSDAALDEAMTVLATWSCEFLVDHVTLYLHHPDGVWRPAADAKLSGA